MSRLAFLSAALCLTLTPAFQVSAVAQQSSAWTQHRDPRGFAVSYPTGWGVTASADGRILVHNANSTMFAVVQPFLLQDATPANDYISSWLEKTQAGAFFPGAMIQQQKQLSSRPDEAAATASYSVNGVTGKTNVLCSIMGASGMLFSVAAPEDAFAAKRPVLLKILRSFHVIQPTAVPAASHGPTAASKPAPGVTYVKWKDPKEGAFTEEIPSGWKAEGGLFRFALADIRPEVVATSPDGNTRLQVGNSKIPGFRLPQLNLEEMHRRFPNIPRPPGEGETITLPTGLKSLVLSYRTGAKFSEEIVQNGVKREHPDLQVVDTQEIALPPDPQANVGYSSSGGVTRFTFNANGKPMVGFVYAATRLMPFPNRNQGGSWFCQQFLYGTGPDVPGERPKLTAMSVHMASSLAYNPAWWSKQFKMASAQTNAYVSSVQAQMKASHEAFMKQMDAQRDKNREDFDARMHAKDETTRHWVNFALGQTDVRDPATGTTYKVAAGHNYYWADQPDARNNSLVVGGDINQRPDINFTPLEEW